MDMSLQMARQSNKVNSVDEMCSRGQFPASLLLERDKNIIWHPIFKVFWAGLWSPIPLRHNVVLITPELIRLTGMIGMWNLLF